jgi:hypothetical protein
VIRTAVYPRAGTRAAAQPGTRAADQPPADGWGDKLVKYIPAEVLAFYIPAYALVEGHLPAGPLYVFVLGLVGTVAYLLVRADRANPPRWYFYLLSALAFIAWAIGTSSIGSVLFHLPPWSAQVTVFSAVFLIPLVDEIVTKYTL